MRIPDASSATRRPAFLALVAALLFAWPAFATTIFNGTIVIIALAFAPAPRATLTLDGWQSHWSFVRSADSITIMAIGWLAGILP